MARLLIRIDLGSGATMGELSSVLQDLAHLSDVGLALAQATAVADSLEYIRGLRGDEVFEFVDRPGRTEAYESALQDFAQWSNDVESILREGPPDPFYWWDRLYRRRSKAGGQYILGRPGYVSPFGPIPVTLEEFAPAAFQALVADEISHRTPLPAVVESLTYENPIEVVLGGAAALLGGLAALPSLLDRIQNWSAHKRTADARADQEESRARQMRNDERIGSSRASQEEMKAELMRYLVDGLRNAPDPQGFVASLSEPERRALTRLTELDIEFETLPELEAGEPSSGG